MRQKLLLTIAISILSIFAAQATYGQIQINIPWGKKKKEDKKVEVKPPPIPTLEPTKTGQNKSSETPVVQDNPLGKIYFSNKPFPAGGGTEGSKTDFTSNEFIYGRLVLNGGTVKDVLKPSPPAGKIPNYYLKFRYSRLGAASSSGNRYKSYLFGSGYVVMPKAYLDKSHFDFDVLPDPNNFSSRFFLKSDYEYEDDFAYQIREFMVSTASPLDEGVYDITLEISGDLSDFRGMDVTDESKWKSVANTFALQFRGSDYQSLKSNETLMRQNEKKVNISDEPLPKEWTLQTNAVAGGFTEARLRAMYLNDRSQYGGNLKIIKFYTSPVKQSYWYIDKNNLGIPKYMYSSQWYQLFVRNLKDNSCFYQHFQMERNYTGGGTYSAVFPKISPSTPISCEKLGVK